jgi:hypothetical protein
MKKKNLKILMISLILFGVYGLTTVNAANALVSTLIINPEKPAPESILDIQVNLGIEDFEGIEQTNVDIQECNGNTGVCYMGQNVTMNLVMEDDYEATIKLEHSDATYFVCKIYVKTLKGWEMRINETFYIYESQPNNNGNGNNTNGNDNGNDTPGFEVLGIFFGIVFIVYMINKKKR